MQTHTVVGELLFLRVYPSGWGLGKIRTNTGTVSINGNALNGLREKSVYEFTGREAKHPKYGESFQVDTASVFVPHTHDAIVKYLAKNYSGIGEKTARRWLEQQLKTGLPLKAVRENILMNPFAIDFTSVTRRKTSSKEKGGIKETIYRNFAIRLGGLDVADNIFRSLAGYYAKRLESSQDPVKESWTIFANNPYKPIRDLPGYGFLRADLLAKKLGVPNDAIPRIAALATYALDEGCNSDGHSYLATEDFKEKIAKIDPFVSVRSAIIAAQQMGEPIVYEDGRFYLEKYLNAERELAVNFAERLKVAGVPLCGSSEDRLQNAILHEAGNIGLDLDDSQYRAVFGILTSDKTIHSITAGPGCGKTAIMEVVAGILGDSKNIGFCAPTGKAAKVLAARVATVGATATTIHSMLGVEAGTNRFIHDSSNLLPFDLLIVDETSMVDLQLMHALVSAVRRDAHIVFLGDSQQLPSVGPGSCLADILKLPFDHYWLSKTHRNCGGIHAVVRQAGRGVFEPHSLTCAATDASVSDPVTQDDFLESLVAPDVTDFIPFQDVVFHPGLPEASDASMQMLLRNYDAELRAVNGDFSQVGLLIARRKGDPCNPGWNTTYVNHLLRETYNGNGQKIPGTSYNTNDRIIIRKNLILSQGAGEGGHDSGVESVVNGDTGYVREFVTWEIGESDEFSAGTVKYLVLELDDGRTIKFDAEHLGCLDLAYAMTVHSAQGSEYKRVISVAVNGAPNFIHRGILFTAWSRAKAQLRIIGDAKAVASILRRSTPTRHSYLVGRTELLLSERATCFGL